MEHPLEEKDEESEEESQPLTLAVADTEGVTEWEAV